MIPTSATSLIYIGLFKNPPIINYTFFFFFGLTFFNSAFFIEILSPSSFNSISHVCFWCVCVQCKVRGPPGSRRPGLGFGCSTAEHRRGEFTEVCRYFQGFCPDMECGGRSVGAESVSYYVRPQHFTPPCRRWSSTLNVLEWHLSFVHWYLNFDQTQRRGVCIKYLRIQHPNHLHLFWGK